MCASDTKNSQTTPFDSLLLFASVSMPQPIGFNMPQPGADHGSSAPYPPAGGGGYGAPYAPPAQNPGYPPPAHNPGYPPPASNPGYPPPQQQGYGGYPPPGQHGGYPPSGPPGAYTPSGPPGGYAPPANYPPPGQVVSQQPAPSGGKGWKSHLICLFWVVLTVKMVLVMGYGLYCYL